MYVTNPDGYHVAADNDKIKSGKKWRYNEHREEHFGAVVQLTSEKGMTNKSQKIKTYCIVPYCSTSNPVQPQIETTNAVPRRPSSKLPPIKPGRKRDKEHQSRWYPRKQKKGKRKVGRSTDGNATRRGGKAGAKGKTAFCLAGFVPHPKREACAAKREKNRKWVFSPNRRLLKIMPLSPYRLMSS